MKVKGFSSLMLDFPLPTAYFGLEPAAVWHHFAALNALPRPSGHEDAVRRHIQSLAEARGAQWKSDARGNLCVRVPASDQAINAPIVVLQSHLDMVCQKRPDVAHDFASDPIIPRRVDDQIYASGTTLGADNGIGAAMMIAFLSAPDLVHGPLELLFTVEEETGLYGAAHLDPNLVVGRLLVNLDSEDPDEITIGCAGGGGVSIFQPIERQPATQCVARLLRVGGLAGGHSGIQINEPLGNALKILGEVLDSLVLLCPEMRICALEGGTAHNAIPRDAGAVVCLPAAQFDDFERGLSDELVRLRELWGAVEPGLTLLQNPAPSEMMPLSQESGETVLRLLQELPHGVSQMSARFGGKVQTSSNLAEVSTRESEIEWHVSNRSFLASEMEAAQNLVAEFGKKIGARVEVRDAYPGWEPRGDSPLLNAAEAAFEAVSGQKPKVEVVHAGLECGILSDLLPGLDAISFGPLIRGPHTPEEWVSVSSVATTWAILTRLLADLAI